LPGILGIIGGLGPEATVFYYRLAVRLYRASKGGSPRVVIYSIPLEEMCDSVKSGSRERVASLLEEALRGLAASGATVALIAANTPHIAWREALETAEALGVKLVSIFEPAAAEALRRGYRRVGILATSATLEAGFYQEALKRRGIEAVHPPGDVQRRLDQAIERLALGGPEEPPLEVVVDALKQLEEMGVDAAMIACTDLSPHADKLAGQAKLPLIDASLEHVKAAVSILEGLGSGP